MELQKVPPDVDEPQAYQNRKTQRILKQKNNYPKIKDPPKLKINRTNIREQTGTEAILPCDISNVNLNKNTTVSFINLIFFSNSRLQP